jgi:uncharacterized protein YfdQ (DUF2303 family)
MSKKLETPLCEPHLPESAIAAHLAFHYAQSQPLHEFTLQDKAKTPLHLHLRTGEVLDLQNYASHPRRFIGDQPIKDSESFGKLVLHYKEHQKLVTFSKGKLTVRAILNYHEPDQPAWMDHTLTMRLEKSKELLAWEKACDPKGMSQTEFMEFLEDRLSDIDQFKDVTGKLLGPTQSDLQAVISDLSVTSDSKFRATRDLSNDTYKLQCDCDQKTSVEVPRVFYVGIPIYEGHPERYLIPVLLRYRVAGGNLTFIIRFQNWQKIEDTAWEGVRLATIEAMPPETPHINIP